MERSEETLKGFAKHLKEAGKQPATVESYCRDAKRFFDYLRKNRLAPKDVEPETLIHYQTFMRYDCDESDNTVRRSVIGVRQFYRYLTEQSILSPSGGHSPFDYVAIPMRDESIPEPLTEADVDELMAVVTVSKPPLKKNRDGAIVCLLAYEGLKANELISLRWSDFLYQNGRGSLNIGGNRARIIELSPKATEWLSEYRNDFKSYVAETPGFQESQMFVAFKGREAACALPALSRHGLKFMLYELGDKAGVPMLNTEALRHYAITHMIAGGRSPEDIMQKLGLRRLGVIAKHFRRSSKSPDSLPHENHDES